MRDVHTRRMLKHPKEGPQYSWCAHISISCMGHVFQGRALQVVTSKLLMQLISHTGIQIPEMAASHCAVLL